MHRWLVLALFTVAGFGQSSKSCESLKALSLPDTTISSVASVAAGPFSREGSGLGRGAAQPPVLPAFCRVAAVIAPASGSHIEVEFWMPAANWNGKFEAVGNGGFAGSIVYNAMEAALKEGYATASTDTGHKGGSGSFALGHPEAVTDFAYRSVHEMVLKAKALMTAYYGRGPRLSYWNGCSTGGRQGLKEAQRFPEDFDGIVAGAPANNTMHMPAWHIEAIKNMIQDGRNVLPATKYPAIAKAVMDACDTLDGVKDNLLTDPRRCHFDPGTLLCSGAESDRCLTPVQVETVREAYQPAKTRSGQVIFPSVEPGTELAWATTFGAAEPPTLATDAFKYLVYGDADWDWHNFDLERDTAAADRKDDGVIGALDPDLAKYKTHGGKLLLYHGWNDTNIAPENTINYYSSVLQKMGPKQDDWMRLFMVPGMQHCGGGPGPNQFNAMGAMERWRETGSAPEQMVAYHVTGAGVDMTRPLCAYPKVAVYKGVGSANDAASFACK